MRRCSLLSLARSRSYRVERSIEKRRVARTHARALGGAGQTRLPAIVDGYLRPAHKHQMHGRHLARQKREITHRRPDLVQAQKQTA